MQEKKFDNFEIDGIDMRDYPDFVDAYISSASVELEDGSFRDATDEELEELNDDSELVYSLVMDKIF